MSGTIKLVLKRHTLLGRTISVCRDALASETSDIKVDKILEVIRTGGEKIKGQIEEIRNKFESELALTGDKKKAKLAVDALKKKLPGVLWSGQFTTRDKDVPLSKKLVAYSGLMCGDLDSLGDKLAEVRKKLEASPHVAVLFLSPTADGLKVIFRAPADAEKHAGVFAR